MNETLAVLTARVRTLLPEDYQETFETLEPKPMRAAGLKYDIDGKVAWNEIWGSFCDLAMAGGPPHKGRLLEPGTARQIEADPDGFERVVREICRGIEMVTQLPADPSPVPGWVRVTCLTETMADWLARAIVMENVAVRVEGLMLDLPAAPGYRLEREIKNVITVIAKTCHYWLDHMPRTQQRAIAQLFTRLAAESPLVQPALPQDAGAELDGASEALGAAIRRQTGLPILPHHSAGWLGVECASVRAAIWMMRLLVVSNVLSRREGTTLLVPVNPAGDPRGTRTVDALAHVHGLALSAGIVQPAAPSGSSH